MKILTVFFVVLSLCFCTFFNANSIYIDGNDDGTEWDGAETQLLLNGESNCKVNFGLIKCKFDSKTNTVYLCVMFIEPGLSSDNRNVGVSLQIDDSDPFIVSADTVTNEIDVDKYYFEGVLNVDENKGVTAEMRIGIKHGLPDVLNGKVRFYDSEGVPSNVYGFSIQNTEVTTQNSYQVGYNDNSETDKTTRPSSKETTLKITELSTTKNSKEKTNKDYWSFLDTLLHEETTRITDKTTKKKTESSSESTKTKSFTSKSIELTSAGHPKETVTVLTYETDDSEPQLENNISLQKGDIYKTITLIAGGLALVVISFLGTAKSKKDNNNGKDPK